MIQFLAAGLVAYGAYHLLTDEEEREINFDLLCTGPPSEQTVRTIQRSVASILRRYGTVKIGKTTDPNRRFQSRDYQDYDTMFILYEGSSAVQVSRYETHFITRFRSKLRNRHAHSTGRQPRRRVRRHFLYAVASK